MNLYPKVIMMKMLSRLLCLVLCLPLLVMGQEKVSQTKIEVKPNKLPADGHSTATIAKPI
jgi:hypothetical protein